jgi:hypothetical protein
MKILILIALMAANLFSANPESHGPIDRTDIAQRTAASNILHIYMGGAAINYDAVDILMKAKNYDSGIFYLLVTKMDQAASASTQTGDSAYRALYTLASLALDLLDKHQVHWPLNPGGILFYPNPQMKLILAQIAGTQQSRSKMQELRELFGDKTIVTTEQLSVIDNIQHAGQAALAELYVVDGIPSRVILKKLQESERMVPLAFKLLLRHLIRLKRTDRYYGQIMADLRELTLSYIYTEPDLTKYITGLIVTYAGGEEPPVIIWLKELVPICVLQRAKTEKMFEQAMEYASRGRAGMILN